MLPHHLCKYLTEMKEYDDGKTSELECAVYLWGLGEGACQRSWSGFIM